MNEAWHYWEGVCKAGKKSVSRGEKGFCCDEEGEMTEEIRGAEGGERK